MDNIKAVTNGDRIECRKCGALLCKIENYDDHEAIRIPNKILDNIESKEIDKDHVLLEIKCKHKSQGKYCDTINEILS